jgi:hypothetical protein
MYHPNLLMTKKSISQISSTYYFNKCLNERDSWNGEKAKCVVCGMDDVYLDSPGYIIPHSEEGTTMRFTSG